MISALLLFIENYWAVFIVAGIIYFTLYMLQGVGLYTLSRKAGINHAWLSFVPFACNVQLGKLAGACSLFGQKIKNGGLYCAIFEFLYCALNILSLITQVLLKDYYNMDAFNYVGYPESLRWAYITEEISYYVGSIVYIVYLIFMIVILFGFFRKYAARNSWTFSILSVFFPIVKGAFIFAVRNNVPVDYESYIRAQREAYYRQARQYYDNSYSRPPYNDNRKNGDDQSNNGGTPYAGDPFEEFSDKNKKPTDETEDEKSQNDQFFGK